MKHLKRFNEASFDRIEEFIKMADKIINYDEIELEEGDEPSNTDILSELGDLCNELTFTSEELQQVINSGRISDPNKFLQIILDETLRDEEAMGNDETPTLNTEDIETKIQDAAYSLRGFGTMTKNATFINGAKWAIHNLTDAEIKHMRENTDPDDHSFFGLRFNESKSYTLDDYISDSFKVYNDQFGHEKGWTGTTRGTNVVPHLVLSRAFTGLLLLTQATSKDQDLTQTIVDISILIDPIMQQIGTYNREKYRHLMNIDSSIHNRDFNEEEYINRVVATCPPLEFIQTCYFESDEDAPFDLNKFSQLYSKIKIEAEKVFNKSIWSKK